MIARTILLLQCLWLAACAPGTPLGVQGMMGAVPRPEQLPTPLQKAVQERDFKRVERLVASGAPIDETTKGVWRTPLQIAIYETKDEKTALYLLGRGASARGSMLDGAITLNSPAVADTLIKRGAEVTPPSNPSLLLDRALRERIKLRSQPVELDRNLEIVALLLAAGVPAPPDSSVSFSNPLLADDAALQTLAAKYRPIRP